MGLKYGLVLIVLGARMDLVSVESILEHTGIVRRVQHSCSVHRRSDPPPVVVPVPSVLVQVVFLLVRRLKDSIQCDGLFPLVDDVRPRQGRVRCLPLFAVLPLGDGFFAGNGCGLVSRYGVQDVASPQLLVVEVVATLPLQVVCPGLLPAEEPSANIPQYSADYDLSDSHLDVLYSDHVTRWWAESCQIWCLYD